MGANVLYVKSRRRGRNLLQEVANLGNRIALRLIVVLLCDTGLAQLCRPLVHAIICPLQIEAQSETKDDAEEEHGRVYGKSLDVARAIGLRVEVRGPDLGQVGEAIDDGVRCCALLLWPGKSGRNPGESDIVAAIDAAEHEEDGEIAGRRLRRGSCNDEAHQCKDEGHADVAAPLGHPIRQPRDQQRDDHGEDVGRCSEEQRRHLGHAECRHDRGDELRDSCCSRLADHSEAEQVQIRILEGQDKVSHQAAVGCVVAHARIGLEAVQGDCSLSRRKPPCRGRVVGQDEDGDEGDADSDATLDDEQPPPAWQTMGSVEPRLNAGSNETRKGACKQGA